MAVGEQRAARSTQERLAQVLDLVTRLGRYYLAHPQASNQVLTTLAAQIQAYALALDRLCQSPGALCASLVQELAQLIAPVDAEEAERLRRTLPHLPNLLPTDARQLHAQCAQRYMTELNMLCDVGEQLLQVRAWREAGANDAEIKSRLDAWQTRHVF